MKTQDERAPERDGLSAAEGIRDFSNVLSGTTRVAGVMGWPIKHSLSPRLHGYWLRRYGIDGTYIPIAVHPDRFEEALTALPALGFAGTNVTVPHKEAALATVDEADETARRIGAVNTVTVRDDGSLFGQNTDAFGFIENLRETIPDWLGIPRPAVVLGAGGAARAICVALYDAGVPEVRVVNRTVSRAERLGEELDMPLHAFTWADAGRSFDDACLLVNTTTLGMAGHSPLDLSLDGLPPDAAVVDIVYTPLQTPLLRQAAARRQRVANGLGMLLHQGRPGFKRWFGVSPDVTAELRKFVIEGLPSSAETA